jgi:hypothetical protein
MIGNIAFPDTSVNIADAALAQSFVPTEDTRLMSIQLELKSLQNCTVTVKIQNNLTILSTLYTSAATTTVVLGSESWVTFDNPDIVLLQGVTYYLVVSGCTSANGVRWMGCKTGPYADGTGYSGGLPLTTDFTFRLNGVPAAVLAGATIVRTRGDNDQMVGTGAAFSVTLSPATPPAQSYQWCVDGDVVKDYSDLVKNGAYYSIPMITSDFTQPTLDFYWKPDARQIYPNFGVSVNRLVTVIVTRTDNSKCYGKLVTNVYPNDNAWPRQPIDAYWANHKTLRDEYAKFRLDDVATAASCTPATYGEDLLRFTSAMVRNFKAWRAEFGYKPLGTWDPNTPIPTDTELSVGNTYGEPVTRGSGFAVTPLPIWFLSNVESADPRGVENFPSPNQLTVATLPCSYPLGQHSLYGPTGFTSRNQLGAALGAPWHDSILFRIGGTMATINAPNDGLFWWFYNYVGSIDRAWLKRPGHPIVMDWMSLSLMDNRATRFPPCVTLAFADSVIVGTVDASQFVVNGIAATEVEGSGAGPYVFSGFPPITGDSAHVEILPGNLLNAEGQPFAGFTRTYRILDPTLDADGDGLSNGFEMDTLSTDPEKADTDGDGVSDSAELAVGGNPLDPTVTAGVGPLARTFRGVALSAPYPNPARGRSLFAFQLERAGHVELSIQDVLGRRIRSLVSGEFTAGVHEQSWDGTDDSGHRLAAGMYFVRIQQGGESATRHVVFLN